MKIFLKDVNSVVQSTQVAYWSSPRHVRGIDWLPGGQLILDKSPSDRLQLCQSPAPKSQHKTGAVPAPLPLLPVTVAWFSSLSVFHSFPLP